MTSNYHKITQDNIRRRGEEFDDIGHFISEQLYSDRSHFVYELLQNAEDALDRRFRENPLLKFPCSVKFVLFEDRLEFRHFGQLFNEADVTGVSDVLKGTKHKNITQIGKFGIGFKSVYTFTATPEIDSGDEHFVIERYIRPKAKEPCSNMADGETLFVFPFNHKDLSKKGAFALILDKLKTLGPRVLLFLNRVNEIKWSVEPNGGKGQYLKESQNKGKARRVTVIGQNNGQDENENWLIFERPVPVPDGSDKIRVEVGFRLETRTKDEAEGITRIKDAPLVVYFPTEKATRFGFLIQGPYRTTPSRDNIPKDDPWNTTLVGETAHLLAEVLPSLKELGLLSVSLLEALPIRMDDFPQDSMFYPIVAAVREKLMNGDLLPADDGTFTSARWAKLAGSSKLRELLTPSQLKSLFQSNNAMKWLSREITERLTPDLRVYLIKELGIEEIDPEGFTRKISKSFLESQSDEWIISLYRFVGPLPSLWKQSSHCWNPVGPLLAKSFIRLKDNSHVRPFRDDKSPNAYLSLGSDTETDLPIIKTEVSQHLDVQQFLRDLGIPELDIIVEVIGRILPKYTTDSSQVSIDEHKRDMTKIEQAYKTDSQEKKHHRLVELLRATPFIRAETPGLESISYRRPTELYFRNDELMAYLSGNDTIGFISQDYSQPMLACFRDLGASDGIRISSESHPGSTEFVSLKVSSGYGRGLRGFDPGIAVAGLEHALTNISVKTSEIIWNKVVVPYRQCIKGKIGYSSRQDFSPDAVKLQREEEQISDFGHLLIDTEWLPDPGGGFVKPSKLRLEDLPESFMRDEKVADQLGMKKDIDYKRAEEAGIPVEYIELIELMSEFPGGFQRLRSVIAAPNEKPIFPTRTVVNLKRRKESLTEQLADAPKKEYEEHERSVRTTRGLVDSALWLRNQYTNDAGQMVCQICKEEMPFRKRDGEYYFEAVEALSWDYFKKEHEAQFLALCPLCAAMYREFVKCDERAMKDLNHALRNSEEPEVSLKLGTLDTSIRFVESHFSDIRTILGDLE